MNIYQKITLAKEINQHIAANIAAVWPGFTPVPFILYDENNQVAIGAAKWPERYKREQDDVWVAEGFDPKLMGNTTISYHGIQIAIWDTRTWPDNVSISTAAGSIAHEMFHAFQYTGIKPLYPNDLLLPQYPHTTCSVALVIEENKFLSEILSNPDKDTINKCLENIAALRKLREAEISADFFEYDKRCEGFEGTAAYVEIRMKAIIEGKTPFEAAADYLTVLTSNNNLLEHYRHRCYAAGLILCLVYDVILPDWQTKWATSDKTLYDWMADKLPFPASTADISSADLNMAGVLLTAYQDEKDAKINDFLTQPLTSFEGAVQLTAFDPMNLTCDSSRCLHLHGKIRFGEKEHAMLKPFLAEYGDTILDVKRILMPNISVEYNGTGVTVEGLGDMKGYIAQSSDTIRRVIIK